MALLPWKAVLCFFEDLLSLEVDFLFFGWMDCVVDGRKSLLGIRPSYVSLN